MKFNLLKTRRGKLKAAIERIVNGKLDGLDINKILASVDEYEKDNLNTIEKLNRGKKVVLNKISGALKQTINAHGPITKNFIGSASKRVYGSLLEKPIADNQTKKPTPLLEIILNWIKRK